VSLPSSSSYSSKPHKETIRSVDRIAALQPRKWDPRSLAHASSLPSFGHLQHNRGGGGGGGGGMPAWGTGGPKPGPNGLVSLAGLPDNHPAHTHPSVHPAQPSLAQAKALAAEQLAKEKAEQASTQAMLGANAQAVHNMFGPSTGTGASQSSSPQHKLGSSASAPALHSPAGSSAAGGGAHVKFAAEVGGGGSGHTRGGGGGGSRASSSSISTRGMIVGALSEELSPEESALRRAESLSLHRARASKRKAKESAERELFGAVMRQLGESRLDHLHRWRNAFDGTKQKMDRLLIKRLVSRAEARAAAMEGGADTMAPVVDAVLSAQEITEVTTAGGTGTHHGSHHHSPLSPSSTVHSASRLRPSAGGGGRSLLGHGHHHLGGGGSVRDGLLADDFAVADALAFDGEGGAAAAGAQVGSSGGWTGGVDRGELRLSADERVARSILSDAGRHHLADQLQLHRSGGSGSASDDHDAYAAAGSRRKHTSGMQQRHTHAEDVIFEE
jgi:hypothetical protein